MSKRFKKVCVCGHFGFGKELLNGQTVKTKILAAELDKRFTSNEVSKIDTHGGKSNLLSLPFRLFGALRNHKNVIILPAHNGLRIIAPILVAENVFFKRRLHYSVIGGWLPEYLKSRRVVARALKRFHCIYVETETMKRALEAQGYSNVKVVVNCKPLSIKKDIDNRAKEPYRLCTFSRVMREKGIEDAVNAVNELNQEKGRTVYTLDIYGPVDPSQTEWFESLRAELPQGVDYRGEVRFDKSVEVLQNYFALLFPTRFYTEGVPGTIIDGYAAALPVISSRWECFGDMVADGVTGVGYDFGNVTELKKILEEIANDPDKIEGMRQSCVERAKNYMPENALETLINEL